MMMRIILGLAVLICFVVGDLEMKYFETPDCTGDAKVDRKLKTDGTCYNQTHHKHDRFVTAECDATSYTIHIWQDDKCTKPAHDHAGKTGVCAVNPHRNTTSGLFTCTTLFSDFSDWSKQHGKVYATAEETFRRREIFESNVAWINKRNTELEHMTVGLNEFADLTQEEFERFYLVNDYNGSDFHQWVMENTVEQDDNNIHVGGQCETPVRNQGKCGSCWAMASSCALEALLCIPGLEENKYGWVGTQELVDCACNGCGGGYGEKGLAYFQKNGICYEAEYPYTAKTGKCQSSKCKHPGSAIGKVVRCQDKGGGITRALAGNFVDIAIDAGGLDFRFYKSGTYGLDKQENSPLINCNKHKLNHEVTCVSVKLADDGENAGNYHIKNSWGTSWGDGGYFDMPAEVNCLGCNGDAGVYPVGK